MNDPSPVGVGETSAHDREGRWPASTARWVQEEIITEDQARRIIEFESLPAGTRSTLLAEVLGYLGAALTVTAIAALTGEQWSEISFAGHVVIVAAATSIGAAGGAVAGHRLRSAGPARGRSGDHPGGTSGAANRQTRSRSGHSVGNIAVAGGWPLTMR